jgi:hypothetical protein
VFALASEHDDRGVMSDLAERAPAQALMDKLLTLRGTPDIRELPWGMVRVSPDALNWVRGIRGELEMARQLRRLGPEWTVLHSVPVGERDSDIDHLAIGPGGVFPINAKRLVDARVWTKGSGFRVNGDKRPYLRNAAFEAARVEGVLQRAGLMADVVPVIAVSGARTLTVDAPQWDGRAIQVTTVDAVVRRLRRRRAVLDADAIVRTSVLLRNPANWTTKQLPADDPEARALFRLVNRGIERWNLLMWMLRAVLLVGVLAAGWGLVHLLLSALTP